MDSYASLETLQQHVLPAADSILARDSGSQPTTTQGETFVIESLQSGSSAAPARVSLSANAEGCATSNGVSSLPTIHASNSQGSPSTAHGHTYKIVGMDAEWQPLDSFSPVTLLQISTRSTAFLVDMMWFCRPAPLGWSSSGELCLVDFCSKRRYRQVQCIYRVSYAALLLIC